MYTDYTRACTQMTVVHVVQSAAVLQIKLGCKKVEVLLKFKSKKPFTLHALTSGDPINNVRNNNGSVYLTILFCSFKQFCLCRRHIDVSVSNRDFCVAVAALRAWNRLTTDLKLLRHSLIS